MFKKMSAIGSLLVLSIHVVAGQDSACPRIVEDALELATLYCTPTGRNQACYGHYNVTAEPQPDAAAFTFENQGDVVDVASISRLELASLDETEKSWGVALMRLQANLPDTLPGQNVTVLVFGDTEIRNAASSVLAQQPPEIEASVGGQGVNVRALPSMDARVLATVSRETTFALTGRSTDDLWVRARVPDLEQTGWIFANFIRTAGDLNTLQVIDTTQPALNPMQAFYFRTGVGAPACAEAPNGMLIQSPAGVGEIELRVNDVEVRMASTVFFTSSSTAGGDAMQIVPVEGGARVQTPGGAITIVAGGETSVMLQDQSATADAPADVTGYGDAPVVQNLPVQVLEQPVEPAPPLAPEAVQVLNEFQPLLNSVSLEDTSAVLDYVLTEGDVANVADFVVNELGYTELTEEAESFLEVELGQDLSQFENYGVQPDSDADGVADDADACPSRAGLVENQGCPAPSGPDADYDRDGVRDGDDTCPNVSGPVDNGGCPRQS